MILISMILFQQHKQIIVWWELACPSVSWEELICQTVVWFCQPNKLTLRMSFKQTDPWAEFETTQLKPPIGLSLSNPTQILHSTQLTEYDP